MIAALILNPDALLDECAQAARARGMHLISDGFRVVVSPIVPPGFFKIAVKVKTPSRAVLESQPCAA